MNQLLQIASRRGDLQETKNAIQNGANIHFNEDAALRIAVSEGHLEVVKFLITNGATVSAKSNEALCTSANSGNLGMVKMLVENGADIHSRNNCAFTTKYNDINTYISSQVKPTFIKKEFHDEVIEDSNDFQAAVSDIESIQNNRQCVNDSPITLMPYEDKDSDELITVYFQNSKSKFKNGNCITKEELKSYLNSDIGNTPSLFMSIYTKPIKTEYYLTGQTSKPTGRIVVRLPFNQHYITLGSVQRILKEKNQEWFALPLFGGKPRRIGNLRGLFGTSMNHGQVPGSIIYKLFTKNEIENRVTVLETSKDYTLSLYLHNNMGPLLDIFGLSDKNFSDFTVARDKVLQHFIDTLIKSLTDTNH